MTALFQLCAVIVAAVLVQLLFPGRDVYHYGWYNVALAALIVVMLMQLRGSLTKAPQNKRARLVVVTLGTALIGLAGIANGLLAPDTQTVIGAPGASVRVDELGRSVQFPLVESASKAFPPLEITGGFLLRPLPRTVVEVQAFDKRGAHLTVTQPSGSAFLSPVLLMQARQTIAGLNLPFDAFAVPAVHRIVKAVLFSPQQAAQLRAMTGSPSAAVLFDVEDEAEHSLPHGLAFVRDGDTAEVAGLRLHPKVVQYPALEIVAIPNVIVVGVGMLFIIAGAVLLLRPARMPSANGLGT